MKTFLIVLLTAGVTFAVAQWLVSNGHSADFKQQLAAAEARWQSEKTALESALAAAKVQPPPSIAAVPATVVKSSRLSAAEILQKLLAIKPGAGVERNRNIRLVVFYLESLHECGPAALPVIRDFFAQNQDIDYTTEDGGDTNAAAADSNSGGSNRQRGRSSNSLWYFRRGGELRTDFVLPPSLRLGLVDVVRAIGGADAELILASVLETTGRGIEVAYVAKSLEEMAPGKYRDAALTSAKDLLAHPPTIDSPNGADNMAEGYLFDVLKMYNDTSFAATAQIMLIGAAGGIDRNALDYLSSTLKEQAIPSLYQAYLNPALTNQFDKVRIAGSILNYAGQNPTANQLLTDVVANTNLDSRMRAFTVARLAGGNFGPFSSDSPSDPAVIQSRLQLAQNLLGQTTDERIVSSLNSTIQNLNNLLAGKPIENNFGGRGRRGGPGGG